MKFNPKKATSDYTADMLPATRKALFFDVVKLQWRNLALCGGLLLLFAVPLLLSQGLEDMFIATLYQSLDQADAAQLVQAGEQLAYFSILRSLVNIMLIVLLCLPLAGVCRILRQHAWGENVHTLTDLLLGIRDNFRQTAALGALAGLIFTLCLALYYWVSAWKASVLSVVALLPIALSLLFVLPILAISLVMIPVYANPLRTTLKNAFAIYTGSLGRVLLALSLCLAIWIPALLPNFYCHMLGLAVGMLLSPFCLLAWTLQCYDLFDRHINPLVCPELIGRGIVWEFE